MLGVRDLKVRVASEYGAAGCTGRVLGCHGDYAGLLQILLSIERLLRHVFAVHRILNGVRGDFLVLLLLQPLLGTRRALLAIVILTVTRTNDWRCASRRRRRILHALRRALTDRLEHMSRHTRRRTMTVLQTIHAIRVSHIDGCALRPATHNVPHAFPVRGAQALSGAAQHGRATLLVRRCGGVVQVGDTGPSDAGEFPAPEQVGHSLSSVARVEALIVVRALKSGGANCISLYALYY